MGCGIYKITNTKNNKIYIGSSVDIKKRKEKHFWMLQKGIHDNKFLQSSYNRNGKENFIFDIIEMCDKKDLVKKENYYIIENKAIDMKFGYNLCLVSNSRRNVLTDKTKIQLSKYNLKKNNNFEKFALINIETEKEHIFETLVDAANYLLENGFAKGKPRNVRMTISNSLRGVKLNNGKNNKGSIRKTCYKHKFKIIN
jgi:group I intron endonuclease